MTGIVNPTMGRSEWFLLVLLSMLWGGSFFFIELAVEELKPFTVVLGRTALAAAALIAYVYLRGGRIPASPRLCGAFLVMGALNGFFPYTLIVWGQVQIESGLASILTATTPLFSLVLAHFLTREERITVGRAAGLLLGVCGMAVLIGPEALHGLGLRSLGQLAVLGAAFSYGCAGIYGRRFKGLPPAIAAAGQVSATAILALPFALLIERPWAIRAGALTWGAIFGLALLSTAAAYIIFFRILAAAGATNVMLVTFLIPVSALLLGVFALGERPAWTAFAGMGLIFTGLAGVDGRLLSRVGRGRAGPSGKAAIP